jgi:Holliday junction resolvasome RuvABC endonuclease subunit
VIHVQTHKPVVAGVDLGGRKISVSYYCDGESVGMSHSQVLKEGNRAEELYKLVELVANDGYFDSADYYFIEEPLVGRGVRASLQIAQTCGALLHLLGDMGETEVHLVPVKSWKRDLVGNGNASKEMCGLWLHEQFPDYHARCGDNQDLIDASCIAIYGASLVSRSVDLTRGMELSDETGTRSG